MQTRASKCSRTAGLKYKSRKVMERILLKILITSRRPVSGNEGLAKILLTSQPAFFVIVHLSDSFCLLNISCGYAPSFAGAAKKVKELVGEGLSSSLVDKLQRWEQDNNQDGDVKDAVAQISTMSMQRLKCAPMLSETLEKILPDN